MNMSVNLQFLLLALFVLPVASSPLPKETAFGEITGKMLPNNVSAYLGIPYATTGA